MGAISDLAFGIFLETNALSTVLLSAAYVVTHSYAVIVFAVLPILVWNGVALLFLKPYPFSADGGASAGALGGA